MSKRTTILNNTPDIVELFGRTVRVTQVTLTRKCSGDGIPTVLHSQTFTLVHGDTDSDELIKERTANFNPDDHFEKGCPLCEQLRDHGAFILYDTEDASDESHSTRPDGEDLDS